MGVLLFSDILLEELCYGHLEASSSCSLFIENDT